MQQFVCDKCGNIDLLDLTHPQRKVAAPLPTPLLCAACLPCGWHNHFPQEKYDSTKDHVVNRPSPGTSISLG